MSENIIKKIIYIFGIKICTEIQCKFEKKNPTIRKLLCHILPMYDDR